nr:TonB family protein [Thermoflexibacter sp.]
KKYDLAWWIDELNPILDEMIRTAEGKENQEFWQNIYKYRLKTDRNCGENPELITGWIGKLFPYIKTERHSENLIKNPFIKVNLKDIAIAKEGYAIWAFPTSISSAKIKFFPLGKPPKDMEFTAGMIGISQNKQTFALKPEINWAVYENLPAKEGQDVDYPDFETSILLLPKTKEIIKIKRVNKSVQTTAPVPVVIPKKSTEKEEEDDDIFTIVEVEENAEPVGGMESFNAYISKNLVYPELAKKNKVEGKVYIQFIVNTDGSLSDIKVVKGIGAGCDEEAERLMKNAPAWMAGKINGKPVKQRMFVPIIFRW